MAENENVNKVVYGDQTLIDITDTTADDESVADGEVFYKASGARSTGTMQYVKTITFNGSKLSPDQAKDISLTEADPTVPSWAKQPNKPTYTAEEVGALPYPYKFSQVDLDEADNGITNTISKPFDITDINGRPVGKFAAEASPDGSTKCGIWTYNRRNGNNYGMGLSVSQAKDGTTTYYVSEPYAFREAINVYSKTEIDNKVATLSETKSYLGIS